MKYSNTNEHLYDDIALWEKTGGKELFLEMPLAEKNSPSVLDFGYGFGENLFALSNAYPKGKIYGIDCNPACQKEVEEKIADRELKNITLINKEVHDLKDFANESLDLVLLYDALHGGDGKGKYMLYEESHRILKSGGCLSILPAHLSNWRDREGKKKTYSLKMIIEEVQSFGFEYAGTCTQKGVHWEKCHTMYYIKKGTITFDALEKVKILNFVNRI
ncbi:MAG: class I SAM-dependent methyltransferase [Treponema sp.]|nr:class I SAM-dependent methyltransferase [Treponema sp.]